MAKPLQFPADEQAHPTIVEWWYLNGHLTARDGSRYQFMTCLFKADPRRIRLPFFKFLPLKVVYFMQEIVTDLDAKRTFRTTVPLALAHEESFRQPLLYVAAAGWALTETQPFHYALKTPHLALTLQSKKPPLLENQTGFIDLQVKTTYYYSLSRLNADGKLTVGDRSVPVTGLAWLDHQWADCGWQPADDIWTWFSLQLDNDMEIVAFRYGGKTVTELATASLPDGGCKTTRQVTLTPTSKPWRSSKTGAAYPLSWRIGLPEFKATLEATPLQQAQEMVFGPLNYWEGGLTVHGQIDGKTVAGVGFLELAGVPVEKSRRQLFEQELKREITRLAAHLKHRLTAAAREKISEVRGLVGLKRQR